MNHRERFRKLFNFEDVDRIPLYYYGTWRETKERWVREGFKGEVDFSLDEGPQIPGMDPDWEHGIWDIHGLANTYLIGDIEPAILEENDDFYLKRSSVGEIYMESKKGSSINHTIEFALKPTWESWKGYKRFLDPGDKRRWSSDWEQKAEEVNRREKIVAFMGGSMYGWLRNWMGIENISYLMYDDPKLFEEMVCHITNLFIEVMSPILKKVKFDFVYFFEDCCGSTGPLFSPKIYERTLDKYYKKLIGFYKENGVQMVLVDSDGKLDEFVPLWIGSGIDIIFPVEVGKWKASPAKLRKKYGKNLKIMGAVDKHVIALGEDAIRKHLIELEPEVRRGGFLPIPDHRIPPNISYKDMLSYVRIFKEIFSDK